MASAWGHCKPAAAALAALLIFPGAGAGAAAVPGPRWVVGWEAGLERARAAGRPAFVYFQAAWCSWCHRYERETLADPRVREAVEARAVPVLVDYDARPDLFARLGGRGLPFTALVDGAGRPLAAFTGILAPDDLLAWLGEAAARTPGRGTGVLRAPPPRGPVALEALRAAFLERVESLYDPALGTLAGRFETGAGLKRTSPLTWLYLMGLPQWRARAARAVHAEVARLLDRGDGGFFYFFDPHRTEPYRETSKLLEANAWMTAWAARAGAALDDPTLRRAARSGLYYLELVLRDPRTGGFFQAQLADAGYYGLPPHERLRARPPPVDPVQRADTNAQAAWALALAADALGMPRAADMAREALGFVLRVLAEPEGLRHARVAGRRPPQALARRPGTARDLPRDLLWVAAAAQALARAGIPVEPADRLEALTRRLGRWLGGMAARGAPLDPATAALGLWVCAHGPPPSCGEGVWRWLAARLVIGPETPPEAVVLGLAGRERRETGRAPPGLLPGAAGSFRAPAPPPSSRPPPAPPRGGAGG